MFFGKGTQPFDFIKHNWKSAYRIKYIIQINGGLIMVFENWGNKFFLN